MTLPPEERFSGPLVAPRWYRHQSCGRVTGMPEEIMRTYLVDPFHYNASTFCTGCSGYVPIVETFWEDTGENMGTYMAELQRKWSAEYGNPPCRG